MVPPARSTRVGADDSIITERADFLSAYFVETSRLYDNNMQVRLIETGYHSSFIAAVIVAELKIRTTKHTKPLQTTRNRTRSVLV
jgi:hypothetical protein